MGNAAEIVGKVQNDLSIRAYQATDFGDKIGKCTDGNEGLSYLMCCQTTMPWKPL